MEMITSPVFWIIVVTLVLVLGITSSFRRNIHDMREKSNSVPYVSYVEHNGEPHAYAVDYPVPENTSPDRPLYYDEMTEEERRQAGFVTSVKWQEGSNTPVKTHNFYTNKSGVRVAVPAEKDFKAKFEPRKVKPSHVVGRSRPS